MTTATQKALDEALGMLNDILSRIKRIEAKLGIVEPQAGGAAPVAPVLRARAARIAAKGAKK